MASGNRVAGRVQGELDRRTGVEVSLTLKRSVDDVAAGVVDLHGVGHERDGPHGSAPGRRRIPHVAQGIGFVVVLHIHHRRGTELLQVRDTGDGASLLTGLGENRKKNRGKDSDDGNDDEQFDEGKASFHLFIPSVDRGRGGPIVVPRVSDTGRTRWIASPGRVRNALIQQLDGGRADLLHPTETEATVCRVVEGQTIPS